MGVKVIRWSPFEPEGIGLGCLGITKCVEMGWCVTWAVGCFGENAVGLMEQLG